VACAPLIEYLECNFRISTSFNTQVYFVWTLSSLSASVLCSEWFKHWILQLWYVLNFSCLEVTSFLHYLHLPELSEMPVLPRTCAVIDVYSVMSLS
jgi:hypothetical protein